MSKVDNVLHLWANSVQDNSDMSVQIITMDEAKQQLLAEVLDTIGEDKEIPKRLVEKEHLSRSQRMVKSQNALRSRLRKAAKERFK